MVDKSCIQQVLGCLMQHPQFLSEIDKYSFTLTDFSTRFEKYIFAAIKNLYDSGATNITAIDIENYLEFDNTAKAVFTTNNGIEYLQDIEEFSNVENFPYYYNKLKKLNLLKDLKKQGIDTTEFYVEDITAPNADEINSQFESLTIKDIVDKIKGKLLKLESDYVQTDEVQTELAFEGMRELIETINESLDIGLPIQGFIYNQVIDGAQKGALTIRSGGSGVGKTRQAVGDACYLAYPIRFNWDNYKWEQTGSCEKILFIVTEQTFKQVRKMILAYITGIPESKFKYNDLTDIEKSVIEQALNLMEYYKDNFILTKMPNPTIELVKAKVREECLLKNIEYVFYDYIFIGPALLNEFKGFSLRNDEVLLMFATALKDLAVELGVAMMTSTQVNANVDDNKNIRNESSLAGGRSTINKADNGAIMARPSKEELETLEPITSQYGIPNIVTDIFKVRSGEWNQVRIWSKVDLGTMRKQDLFITDSRLDPIEDFFDRPEYHVKNWDNEKQREFIKIVEGFNNGELGIEL